jgi:hypothetical protein
MIHAIQLNLKLWLKKYKRDWDAKLLTKEQELLDLYPTCDLQELTPLQIPHIMDAINTHPTLPSLEDTEIKLTSS